jgi:hypothetical protein
MNWTIANTLTRLRNLVFPGTKAPFWGRILQSTNSNRGRAHVKLSRPKALMAKESIKKKFHIFFFLFFFVFLFGGNEENM